VDAVEGVTAMLTVKQFYKGALLMPLVLPLIIGLSEPLTRGWHVHGFVNGVGMLLMFSLTFGCLPYLFVLFYLWNAVSKAKTSSGLRKLIYKAPLLYLVPLFIVTLLLQYRSIVINADWELVFAILFIALGIGYGYVLLTQGAYHAARRLGWISPWPEAEPAAVSCETPGRSRL
jgi:hypothetical protein